MIRHYIRILTDRLATDVQGLRLQNATLEAAVAKAIGERQEAEEQSRMFYNSCASAVHQASELRADLARAEAKIVSLTYENVHLRSLAGNTEATASEQAVLDVVARMPGALAKDIGRDVSVAVKARLREAWCAEHPGQTPNDWMYFVRAPGDNDIADEVKHLSSLHKKALVRRERAGQSYRYWVADAR